MRLLVLISIILTTMTVYPAVESLESENRPEKSDAALGNEGLQNQTVNVRIYTDPNNPAYYKTEKIGVKNQEIQFNTLKNYKDAVVLMLPEEQDNPLPGTSMDRLLYASYAENCESLKLPDRDIFELPETRSQRQVDRYWYLDDAEGNPVNGAVIDFYLFSGKKRKIKIGTFETDGTYPRYIIIGDFPFAEFIVSHSDYGRAKAQTYPWAKSHLNLPLVSIHSTLNQRAAWGYVVDPEGGPIPGVELSCRYIYTPGGGWLNPETQGVVIGLGQKGFLDLSTVGLTDHTGFFRYYMSPLQNHYFPSSGGLTPPGSTYDVNFEPSDILFFPRREKIPNGINTTIVLQRKKITDFVEDNKQVRDGRFHTFNFYYEDNKLTQQEDLNEIFLEIHRDNEPVIKLSADDLKSGVQVPDGTYQAFIHNNEAGNDFPFTPLEVTNKSPEQLDIFMPMITYTGLVVYAQTNEPMEGVFVITVAGRGPKDLSVITDEQWQALHELPLSPSLKNPAFNVFTEIYNFHHIARTDENGRFELICPEEDKSPLAFFAHDFLAPGIHQRKLQPDTQGICKVPTVMMHPAGKIIFKPLAKDPISVHPELIMDQNNKLPWFKTYAELEIRSRQAFNDVHSIYVPADTIFTLNLTTHSDKGYDDYLFPESILLSAGETLDIGECSFTENIPVYVKVIDSMGNPLEGIKVQLENGQFSLSNEQGLSEFMVPPGMSVEFAVTSEGWEPYLDNPLTESIRFQPLNWADEGAIFTLQLSDEMLQSIYEN